MDDLAALFRALADLTPRELAATVEGTAPDTPIAVLPAWDKVPQPATEDVRWFAATDALHRDQRLVRRGWGFVHARRTVGGKDRKVRFPLLSQPVRLQWTALGLKLSDAGDLELSGLISDPELAAELEGSCPPGMDQAPAEQKQEWLRRVAAAAGFPTERVWGDGEIVPYLREDDAIYDYDAGVILDKVALYLARDVTRPGTADRLRGWSRVGGLAGTALAAVYGADRAAAEEGAGTGSGAGAGDVAAEDPAPLRSPLPLDPDQQRAVRRSRTQPVTVITGAPGCGKSHTIAAIALDAVDRGESVLIATQSVHAAEVLGDLLARRPGPTPVMFGDAEKRQAIITELSSGAIEGHRSDVVEAETQKAELAVRTVQRLEAEIGGVLELHWRARRAGDSDPIVLDDFPGLADADLDDVAHELAALRRGWWRRWLAERRLRRWLRAPGPYGPVAPLLEVARDHRALARLAAYEPADLDALWARLARADEQAAVALGEAAQ
ncbi:MAG: AAA family ATPase, partial [Micromonosporaceae bacterium]